MSTFPNIEAAVTRAAGYVQATWQQAVMGVAAVPGMKPIKQSINIRRLYADSIKLANQLRSATGISQMVIATDKIAEKLENGTGPWDMKPMLLGGAKSRMGKHGRYNIIPFRHGTGSNHAHNNNFPTMPQDIYKQARQLKASVAQGNKIKWGGKLAGTEQKYAPGHNQTSGYAHKSGRFEGMVRVEKMYNAATQSQYLTFRVVSDASPGGSWIHPGYEAHNIRQAIVNFCKPAVEDMIKTAAIADMHTVIVEMK